MRWQKLGLLFNADGQYPWMLTHAANPTAELLGGRNIRIYFSTRDSANRSHIAAAVFELGPDPKLLDLSTAPLLCPGGAGAFDDSGASMGCIVRCHGEIRLYYLGWNLGVTVPWRNSVGLAISRDAGRSFQKYSPAPILDRHAVDPYSISYPWVIEDAGAWRMWYGSNLRWGATEREMDHVIKSADSRDGYHWQRDGRVAIPLVNDDYAIARPCVIRDPDRYRMWFAHRGQRYRLGYAESEDGLNWRRTEPPPGLEPAASGWDSDMVTYPCVFDCQGGRYMLYNGAGYGRSGFGLAVMDRGEA